MKQALYYFLAILLTLNFNISPALADWIEPSEPPPGGNRPEPLDVSAVWQTKDGSLTIGGAFLEVPQGALIVSSIQGPAAFTGTLTVSSAENAVQGISGGLGSAGIYGQNTAGGWAGSFAGYLGGYNLTIGGPGQTVNPGYLNNGDAYFYGKIGITGDAKASSLTLGSQTITSWSQVGGYWAASGNNIYSTNAGNVGIGITGPTSLLHVKHPTGNLTTRFEGLSNSYSSKMYLSSASSGDGGMMYVANTNRSNIFSYGDLRFNVGTANISGAIGDERMVIKQGGNVGIGATAPAEKLEVRDDTAGTARVRITDTTQNPELQLQYGENANEHWAVYNNQTDDSFNIWSYNGGSSGDRLTVLQNGNVGIGTPSPSSPLTVMAPAGVSVGESIAKFSVSDATTAYIDMRNNTSANNLFDPAIRGVNPLSASPALNFLGDVTSQDTGNSAAISFQARQSDSQVVNRPVIGFSNWTTRLMTILANGNVGIGTTIPGAKLEVAGQIKITGGGPAAGRVLTSDVNGLATWQTAAGSLWTDATTYIYPNNAIGVKVYDTNSLSVCEGSCATVPVGYSFINSNFNNASNRSIAVYGYAGGSNSAAIYGAAAGTDSYAGYFDGNVNVTGKVGIGTVPQYTLDVNGNARATYIGVCDGGCAAAPVGYTLLTGFNSSTPGKISVYGSATGADSFAGYFQGRLAVNENLSDNDSTDLYVADQLSVGHPAASGGGVSVSSGQNLIYGNAASGALGNLLLLQVNESDKFKVDKDGNTAIAGSITAISDNIDTISLYVKNNSLNYATIRAENQNANGIAALFMGKVAGNFVDYNGTACTSGQILKKNGSNDWICSADSGGSPGGSTTHVQFNNGGAFGGDNGFVYSGGNVGIGTTGPGATLHVQTTAAASTAEVISKFTVSDASDYLQIQNGASANSVFDPRIKGYTNRAAGTPLSLVGSVLNAQDSGTTALISFQGRLDSGAAVVNRDLFDIANYSTSVLRIKASGNVGIGMTNPSQALDLVGSMKLETTTTPTTGVIYKGNSSFIHNFSHPTGGGAVPAGSNIFVGLAAGNFTMGSTAIQTWQSSYNSAVGAYAFVNNTTGYSNTAIGDHSLNSNTTGYYNTAIGADSGRYITGGATANQTSNYSVYLGSQTRALANGDTNEIVIGALTTGMGSNSVVLGNDSITKTILKGNVGIGTTGPTYPLSFAGNVGSKINLYDTPGYDYGFGVQTGLLQIFADSSSDRVGIGYGTSAAFTETLTVIGGNVGIGTTAPNKLLHVYKDSGDNAEIDIQSVSGANQHWAIYHDRSTEDLRFWHNDISGEKNALTLKNNGNVGIGDTSPASLLTVGNGDKFQVDVSGNTTMAGILTVSGNRINNTGFYSSSGAPNPAIQFSSGNVIIRLGQ